MPLEEIGFHGKIPTSLKYIYLDGLLDPIWAGDLPPNLNSLDFSGCKILVKVSDPCQI
jgi:hypothetical protein